jgi:hypothetical protein
MAIIGFLDRTPSDSLRRYVSLGFRGRQLSSPDPDGSQYVPVVDAARGDGFEDVSGEFEQAMGNLLTDYE